MRPPLIRQGEGPAAAIQRYYRELDEQRRKVERVCAQPVSEVRTLKRKGGRSGEGDPRRMRGIPVFARGVGGALTDAELGFKDVDGKWLFARDMLSSSASC